MRMTVITDKAGNIIGAARSDVESRPGAGTGGPVAGPEQTAHAIDVPGEVGDIEDAGELHNKLRNLL